MRAVVTGGTGFVGSNLVRRLLAEGHEVHLIVRRTSDRSRLEDIESDLSLHELEIEDTEALVRLLSGTAPDWLFHLAVHGGYSFETDPVRIVRTNVLGTSALLTAAGSCETLKVFVNTGSSSEYGDRDHAPTEEEPPSPNSNYAITKAASTWLSQRAGRESGRPTPTLRLYSVYGPWEEPRRLIPTLIRHGLSGSFPPLGSPSTVRDFVYVDDVVNAYLRVATSPPEDDPGAIFNIGTGGQTTLRELVEIAAEVFEISGEPRWGDYPPRAWETEVWMADIEKAKRELGWAPEVVLAEGLRRMGEWARDHPDALVPKGHSHP